MSLMIKIGESFKQMLNGLAYQNAGDFLSTREKINVLGGYSTELKSETPVEIVDTVQNVAAILEGELAAVELPEPVAA